jgi:cytochrome d ubiquinol oxidase subunit II
MTHEMLQTLWFILIAVLWIGFYFLEGFDFGVGMLLTFLGKKDEERRAIINTIGPTWDGNEVWLIAAGGAMFAAFPMWYATMFSGFYLALFLLLVGLIIRGIAFEYRSKDSNPKWRHTFDWMITIGSFLSALLLGVAFWAGWRRLLFSWSMGQISFPSNWRVSCVNEPVPLPGGCGLWQ